MFGDSEFHTYKQALMTPSHNEVHYLPSLRMQDSVEFCPILSTYREKEMYNI